MAFNVRAAASINFASAVGFKQLRSGSMTPESAKAKMLLSFPVDGRKQEHGEQLEDQVLRAKSVNNAMPGGMEAGFKTSNTVAYQRQSFQAQ